MKKKYFIGIDVSKHTLDVAFIIDQPSSAFRQPLWKQFENTPAGLKQMQQWLNKANVLFNEQTIVVIENTGIYHRLLWQFFSHLQIDLCIENAAQVKWSLGIARGRMIRWTAADLLCMQCVTRTASNLHQPYMVQ